MPTPPNPIADDAITHVNSDELFEGAPELRADVLARIEQVVAVATLAVPEVAPVVGGGRHVLHTEHLGYLLAEMQHLHRSHPGATW